MTKKQQTRIEKKFTQWVREMPCPLCIGANNSMTVKPSQSKQQFDISLAEPLKCSRGHLTSVLAFNNREVFLITIMDVNKRPVRDAA